MLRLLAGSPAEYVSGLSGSSSSSSNSSSSSYSSVAFGIERYIDATQCQLNEGEERGRVYVVIRNEYPRIYSYGWMYKSTANIYSVDRMRNKSLYSCMSRGGMQYDHPPTPFQSVSLSLFLSVCIYLA